MLASIMLLMIGSRCFPCWFGYIFILWTDPCCAWLVHTPTSAPLSRSGTCRRADDNRLDFGTGRKGELRADDVLPSKTRRTRRLLASECESEHQRSILHPKCSISEGDDSLLFSDSSPSDRPHAPPPAITPLTMHHIAVKTRNITNSIQFYSLFGFGVSCRFRAGPARAAWLETIPSVPPSPHSGAAVAAPPACRLELLEVPSHLLPPNASHLRALDLSSRPVSLGYHHVALDATAQIRQLFSEENQTLAHWIEHLNATSVRQFGKALRPPAVPPRPYLIGRDAYELAFLYDDTGCLVELLHHQQRLPQEVDSGWEPWDGTGFLGGG